MYSAKPDYERAQERINSFWNHEESDRPIVLINFQKEGAALFTKKNHSSWEDYCLDNEYRTEEAAHYMENTVFYSESMPVYMPNMGPEIISAWAGCPYHFGEHTTWTDPCLFDWEKDSTVIDMNHPLAKKLDSFTKLLIEKAKGNFIVGLSDFHPGGDHVAALRDPQVLAIDMLEYPDQVKAKLASSYKEYYAVYDYYVGLLKKAKMHIASWLPITSEKTMYTPSNDFSCMISKEMFDEFFLDDIAAECRYYGNSIYHLDGPGAIRHLNSLLAIPELNAIQWVPGAGRGECARWIDLYKRIQSAGKSLMVYPASLDELKLIMDNLSSWGLCIVVNWDVKNKENARDIMKIIQAG